MRIIGVQGLHIAELKTDGVGIEPTWDKPIAVPSLMSIDIEDNREEVKFFSDDSIEEVIQAFGGKNVTIALGHLSNELEATIGGNTYENGVFVQNTSDMGKEFALLFKAPLSKNGGFQYVCLYKGVLAKNNANYQGKEDSITSSNVELTGIFMPLQSTGEAMIKVNSSDASAPTGLETKWFANVPTMANLTSGVVSTKATK